MNEAWIGYTDEKGEELHYTNQSPPYPPPGWGCDVEKEEESGVKDSTTKGNSCYLDRRCMEKTQVFEIRLLFWYVLCKILRSKNSLTEIIFFWNSPDPPKGLSTYNVSQYKGFSDPPPTIIVSNLHQLPNATPSPPLAIVSICLNLPPPRQPLCLCHHLADPHSTNVFKDIFWGVRY